MAVAPEVYDEVPGDQVLGARFLLYATNEKDVDGIELCLLPRVSNQLRYLSLS